MAVVACFLSKNIKEVFFATNSIGQIISGVFNAWWIIILSVYQLRKMYMEKTLFKVKVGFSYLLWLAASLWAIVGRSEAKSKDNLGINVLPMMFMVFYFIYGLMEVTWLPGYMIFALIFLVQHPQFKDSFLAEAKENAINS